MCLSWFSYLTNSYHSLYVRLYSEHYACINYFNFQHNLKRQDCFINPHFTDEEIGVDEIK